MTISNTVIDNITYNDILAAADVTTYTEMSNYGGGDIILCYTKYMTAPHMYAPRDNIK